MKIWMSFLTGLVLAMVMGGLVVGAMFTGLADVLGGKEAGSIGRWIIQNGDKLILGPLIVFWVILPVALFIKRKKG